MPPGQLGWLFVPVLFLKVANINFRKRQFESAQVFFIYFECRQFLTLGSIMPPTPCRVKFLHWFLNISPSLSLLRKQPDSWFKPDSWDILDLFWKFSRKNFIVRFLIYWMIPATYQFGMCDDTIKNTILDISHWFFKSSVSLFLFNKFF